MDSELWSAIRRLHLVERLSKAAVARHLRIHRDTVNRALAAPDGPPRSLPPRPPVASKLDPFRPYLRFSRQADPPFRVKLTHPFTAS
jgi:transposase